jgi:hypothetical protein
MFTLLLTRASRRMLGVVASTSFVLAIACPVAATTPARSTGREPHALKPITLQPGDQLVVTGSRLRCIVSTAASAAHPPTLVCGVGDVQSPLPGTFAFGIADAAVLVLKATSSRQPQLVVEKDEPSTNGALFPAANRAERSYKIGPGTILLLGGSDVLCSVSSQKGTSTLTCGLAAGGSGTFIIGSYVGVISQRLAVLSKLLPNNKVETIVAKTQPPT